MIVFTDQNFEEEVLKASLPVVVDFWAPWCYPCQMLGPVIEEVAKDYEGKVKIGKLNVDENQKMAEKYNIMSIPTLLIFKKGKVVKELLGVKPKDQLNKEINEVI